MAEFKYADWNSLRGTVPAYYVDTHSGQIEVGEVVVVNGSPADSYGSPLSDDGETERLVGWRHSLCQSFENGRVLVPLRGY